MATKKPDPEPTPDPTPTPWFTVHLGAHVDVSFAWLFGLAAGGAALCVGEPDLIDALVHLLYSL
jgi:hypothetical protein